MANGKQQTYKPVAVNIQPLGPLATNGHLHHDYLCELQGLSVNFYMELATVYNDADNDTISHQ